MQLSGSCDHTQQALHGQQPPHEAQAPSAAHLLSIVAAHVGQSLCTVEERDQLPQSRCAASHAGSCPMHLKLLPGRPAQQPLIVAASPVTPHLSTLPHLRVLPESHQPRRPQRLPVCKGEQLLPHDLGLRQQTLKSSADGESFQSAAAKGLMPASETSLPGQARSALHTQHLSHRAHLAEKDVHRPIPSAPQLLQQRTLLRGLGRAGRQREALCSATSQRRCSGASCPARGMQDLTGTPWAACGALQGATQPVMGSGPLAGAAG